MREHKTWNISAVLFLSCLLEDHRVFNIFVSGTLAATTSTMTSAIHCQELNALFGKHPCKVSISSSVVVLTMNKENVS
jgi:hypothetical protein